MLSDDQRRCLSLAARDLVSPEIAELLDWPIPRLVPRSGWRVRAALAGGIAALGASSKLEAVIILLRRGEIHL